MTDPKTAGYEAYMQGKGPEANPYRFKQTPPMTSWSSGWLRAKREHENQQKEATR